MVNHRHVNPPRNRWIRRTRIEKTVFMSKKEKKGSSERFGMVNVKILSIWLSDRG